jgi:hypothetical protein
MFKKILITFVPAAILVIHGLFLQTISEENGIAPLAFVAFVILLYFYFKLQKSNLPYSYRAMRLSMWLSFIFPLTILGRLVYTLSVTPPAQKALILLVIIAMGIPFSIGAILLGFGFMAIAAKLKK